MILPLLNIRLSGWWLPVLVLFLILVFELLLLALWGSASSDVEAVVDKPARLTAQPADFGLPPMVQYAVITEKPLFRASRRPIQHASQPVQIQQSVKAPQLKQYTLSAIIITGEQRLAMIQNNRSRSMLRLREGDELDSWQVQSITKDTVSLSFADQIQKMTLRRLPGKATRRASNSAASGQTRRAAAAAGQEESQQRPRRNLNSPVKAEVSSGPEPVELRRPDRPKREIQ